MIESTIKALNAYVRDKALSIDGVNKFIYGNADKVIAYSRSNKAFGYPLVFLSRPNVVATYNGCENSQINFYCEITAVTKMDFGGVGSAEMDAVELEAEDVTLNILLEMERLMRLDNDDDLIEFELMNDIDPTMPKWIDAHTGWKMSCKIGAGSSSEGL